MFKHNFFKSFKFKEEELRLLKEKKEKDEYEEYLKLKESFIIEESGEVGVLTEEEVCSYSKYHLFLSFTFKNDFCIFVLQFLFVASVHLLKLFLHSCIAMLCKFILRS